MSTLEKQGMTIGLIACLVIWGTTIGIGIFTLTHYESGILECLLGIFLVVIGIIATRDIISIYRNLKDI